MGKTKKGKVATSFRNNKLTPVHSGKKFKQMRQLRKKGRRSVSDAAFANSYLSHSVLSSPVNKSKSKRKRGRKSSVKTPHSSVPGKVAAAAPAVTESQTTALQYKFRNDHILDTPSPVRISSPSVSATPSVPDNKLMDTIVIEDDEEEDEKGEFSLKLSEEADEKKHLVDPSSVGDKRIVSNPLYEGSDDSRDSAGGSKEAGQSSNPLHEEDIKNESVVILDDEVILVDEKKASGPGLSARNIQTMSKRNPFPRSGPSFKPSTAPDFIPLFSSFGPSRINGHAKETIIQHVRNVARGTRDKARGIYRENRRRNIRPAPAPYHRPERSQPIVAEGPTMMASSHSRRGAKGSLRPIVLDGCNIAMYHGRNKVFSVRGIEIVLEYFLKRGHQKVVTFMPQEKSSGRSPSDRQRMEKMVEEIFQASNMVKEIPSKL